MATPTVWKFTSPEAAGDVESTPQSLQKQQLVRILDTAVVNRPQDKPKPATKQLHNLVGAGALTGTFWGMLFGLLFLASLLGAAIGAAAGAPGGKFTDIGIDDDFIKKVKEQITPGTSALFLMTQEAKTDRVKEALPEHTAELIHSNPDAQTETKLRELFSE
ncbi:DUF1269 domain-containing protein [Streptomyces sp. Wb2n-11]|uniref:DUF1269 domain-containing protein n=1 Tax=Streptomyces sp. Wb2n-11 TaxID=1030533 RepID=UPI000AF4F46F|nr:DUF1269 domain-containing protein [Streptomyces sp. Wb2n-11]